MPQPKPTTSKEAVVNCKKAPDSLGELKEYGEAQQNEPEKEASNKTAAKVTSSIRKSNGSRSSKYIQKSNSRVSRNSYSARQE